MAAKKLKRIERWLIVGVETGMVYRTAYDTSCHTTRNAAEVALRTIESHVTHEKLQVVKFEANLICKSEGTLA